MNAETKGVEYIYDLLPAKIKREVADSVGRDRGCKHFIRGDIATCDRLMLGGSKTCVVLGTFTEKYNTVYHVVMPLLDFGHDFHEVAHSMYFLKHVGEKGIAEIKQRCESRKAAGILEKPLSGRELQRLRFGHRYFDEDGIYRDWLPPVGSNEEADLIRAVVHGPELEMLDKIKTMNNETKT